MRILRGILFGLLNLLVVRAIVAFFGLDLRVARLMQRVVQLPPEQIQLIAWGMSGLIGIIALVCWLAFHIDERLYDFWSPRPALGSVHQVNAIANVTRNQQAITTDVVMIADMQNDNDALVAFHCELRATVNGKDLDQPVIFDGYVAAKGKTSLIVQVNDVPTPTTEGFAQLLARMRYDVTYYFAEGKRRSRRTSKLVQFQTSFQASGVAIGTQITQPIHVRYFDEIEE